MNTYLTAILLLLLLIAAAALWLKTSGSSPKPGPRRREVGGGLAAVDVYKAPTADRALAAATPWPMAEPAAAVELPPGLAQFKLLRREKLAPEVRDGLLQRLRLIPRPPMSLHQLLSPAFLETATSGALNALIMAEAQIAAKVLATVNAPLFGLKRPVSSVGQAVTLLGLNTVRAICLQYMLDDSFKSSSPARRRRFDALMHASSLSSELCTQLVQRLELPEPGALVTQGVLSFLGQLAMTSLLPTDGPAWGPHPDMLTRTRAEQEALGLGAAQLGALLMQAWGLPAGIIEDTADIDATLVTAASALDPRRGSRLALCFLCARLGERLTQGSLTALGDFDPAAQTEADFFHLRSYLNAPALARLTDALHAPAMSHAIQPMLESASFQR